MTTPAEGELRDLILHRLPEPRARELEDRLMLEDDGAERLQDATYDLLDDYVRGRLAASERAAVEQHLLSSSEDLQRAAIAKCIALRPRASPAAARAQAPSRIWAVGALIAACVVVAAILITRFPRGDGAAPGVQMAAADRGKPAREAISATLTLLANAARGASVRTVVVPAGAAAVRLQAEVSGAPRETYRLVLTNADGRVLFSVAHLLAHAAGAYQYVEADVPARDLPPEAHVLVAPEHGGAQPAGSFSWDVRISR